MKMEIKSWLTGNVLYSADAENIKELFMSAIEAGADLSGANLSVQTLIKNILFCPFLLLAQKMVAYGRSWVRMEF